MIEVLFENELGENLCIADMPYVPRVGEQVTIQHHGESRVGLVESVEWAVERTQDVDSNSELEWVCVTVNTIK